MAPARRRGALFEQAAQHPGRLLAHPQALRQQVRGRLVAGLGGEREDAAPGACDRPVSLDPDPDHLERLRRGLGNVPERARARGGYELAGP
jgi:hypothetical protein